MSLRYLNKLRCYIIILMQRYKNNNIGVLWDTNNNVGLHGHVYNNKRALKEPNMPLSSNNNVMLNV